MTSGNLIRRERKQGIHKRIHWQSILKAATWRVVATIDTIFLSFLFTGKITTALRIGFTELFTKIFLYYVHERIIWNNIQWGKGTKHAPDKHARSLAKGASWRFFGTLDTIIIALLVTHQVSQAFSIGFVELFTKILLFYLHERAWLRILHKKKTSGIFRM